MQGRYEALLAAGDALLATRVPADPAARAELVRMLPMQRMAVTGLLRWMWVLCLGLALLQIVVALDRPRSWLMVVVFAAMAGFYAWWTPRNRRPAARGRRRGGADRRVRRAHPAADRRPGHGGSACVTVPTSRIRRRRKRRSASVGASSSASAYPASASPGRPARRSRSARTAGSRW